MAVKATTKKGSPTPPTRPNPSHMQTGKPVGPPHQKAMPKGQKPTGC
jgi:hypothetical protein